MKKDYQYTPKSTAPRASLDYDVFRSKYDDLKAKGICTHCHKREATNGIRCLKCQIAYVWDGTRRSAFKRELSFLLTLADVERFITSPCAYCGTLTYKMGIDRINNKDGYSLENSTSACKDCNKAKNDMSMEDFMIWLSRVYNHLNR
jgi:hypothetical protein